MYQNKKYLIPQDDLKKFLNINKKACKAIFNYLKFNIESNKDLLVDDLDDEDEENVMSLD